MRPLATITNLWNESGFFGGSSDGSHVQEIGQYAAVTPHQRGSS